MAELIKFRWEYVFVSTSEATHEELNNLGSQGWELCSQIGENVVFKRPTIEKQEVLNDTFGLRRMHTKEDVKPQTFFNGNKK